MFFTIITHPIVSHLFAFLLGGISFWILGIFSVQLEEKEIESNNNYESLQESNEVQLGDVQKAEYIPAGTPSPKTEEPAHSSPNTIQTTPPLNETPKRSLSLESNKTRRTTSQSSTNPSQIYSPSIELSAWVEKATKVGLSRVWVLRYFQLVMNPSLSSNIWLSWFKDEKKKNDQCYGHFKLNGCSVEQEPAKLKLTIKHLKSQVIYYRKSDDPNINPASQNHHLFHRNSTSCYLKFKDVSTLENWFVTIRSAIEKSNDIGTPPNRNSVGSEEFDEEYKEYNKQDLGEDVDEVTDTTDLGDESENEDTQVFEVFDLEKGKIELVETQVQNEHSSPMASASIYAMASSYSSEHRESLLPLLTQSMDVTSLNFPIDLCEPTSFLQQMCERMANYHLLNQADMLKDSAHRMAYVSAFAFTMYSNLFRTTKPYTPFLGETFHYKNNDFEFTAEQVSMNPPLGVCHVETPHFKFVRDQRLRAKVSGNSLACESIGVNQLYLKKTGEHYCWTGVKTLVRNMFIGKTWIDHYGETKITNYKTGETAKLEFSKCGFFRKGQHEVKALILDSSGKTKVTVSGKLTESISVSENADPSSKAEIWTPHNQADKSNAWELSLFAQELNRLDDELKSTLPKTDSRLRPDRLALEQKDFKKAVTECMKLEQEENTKRRNEDQQGSRHVPKFFVKNEANGEWTFIRKDKSLSSSGKSKKDE